MGLFDQILSAVGNPDQQANNDGLANIINTVGQLSGNNGVDPSVVNSALSIVGNHVRSSLQQQRSESGDRQVEGLVNQFAGTGYNPDAVSSIFSGGQLDSLIQSVAGRTGLDPNTVQSLLPTLVPIVLNFIQSGSNSGGGNPVLNTFLDSDQDGDVDIADALGMAGRYLGR
ncbi:DUF937 domain-containing protein [Merismopedia glauca]|uniref:DUF937 domain-containing protein n=1 Tax=Merismopedia glauca CCAP 1448/3 TaxID=1296344 RepID=A0A2T1BXC9_9CYAN|nr:DUF937 domain-containing protein [Merismopedia glauca]PSB00567.1 hypothetical protein C7B64_22825 [Merismopedia glauca CCAP 1448/3]